MMNTLTLTDLLLVSPMIALFLASLVPITVKVLRGNVEQPAVATLIQGLAGVFISGLLLFSFSAGKTAFSQALVFDGLTLAVGLIALMASGYAMVLMYENPSTNGRQFSELIFLALSSALGMLILVASNDLLMTFIGLEIMSLALYLMIAKSHEEKLSKESALKYFILGSFASAIFLYGISFIFGSAGSTYLSDITLNAESLVGSHRLFLLGSVLVILGFCFKVSIAPFHAWTPDVYQGAPTPHTAFMATAIKAVSFGAFIRVLDTRALMGSENLFYFLQWLAVITMVVGNVAAVLQNNLKRVLAYSSIAHSGYLMVGLITGGVSEDSTFATSGVVFYLFAYSLMTLGAFAIVSLLEKDENHSLQVDDLAGLAKKRPGVALCLTIFLLSMAGIPPTIGFFGKFYLFTSAIGEGLLWLAIWGVINSVISAYYYLRPIVVMYMKDGSADLAPRSLLATKVVVIAAAILVVILGAFSGGFFQAVEKVLQV
jgi:NADH-quinone oxidoreductase subunit N